MTDEIYEYANGVRVLRRHIIERQMARYSAPDNPNLHEPVEEDWLTKIVRQFNGEHFVFADIGVAIGYYALLVKKLKSTARIIGVDALPDHIAAFKENIPLNGFQEQDFEFAEYAIWKQNADITMISKDFSTHIKMPDHEGNPGQQFTAKAVPIEEFILSVGEPIDLAKIDVQGAEAQIIPAFMQSSAVPLVKNWIIGTHGPRIFQKLKDCMSARYEIIHADPAPDFQPDGLIVANLR